MRPISKSTALVRLTRINRELVARVRSDYEHRALQCGVCPTPGACCRDSGFVNVRISRLEAEQIASALEALPEQLRRRVGQRVDAAIERHELSSERDAFTQRFSCPLYEHGLGCLVHYASKPVPCIVHACYADPSHFPPDEIRDAAEMSIDRLNRQVYSDSAAPMPLPLALRSVALGK